MEVLGDERVDAMGITTPNASHVARAAALKAAQRVILSAAAPWAFAFL